VAGSDNVQGAENQQERLGPSFLLRFGNPQRPYASPLREWMKRKRWSDPCGDVGRLAETSNPPLHGGVVTDISEIPCRVTEVALHRSDPMWRPAHNGEARIGCLESRTRR
jgi:hypothetical protein